MYFQDNNETNKINSKKEICDIAVATWSTFFFFVTDTIFPVFLPAQEQITNLSL